MTVLFGHPTGASFSHHAGLAHYEAGWLESFCVPWMPSPTILSVLGAMGPLRKMADKLRARSFPPLRNAPKSQDRAGVFVRTMAQALGLMAPRGAEAGNAWLMNRMSQELRARKKITVVHSYEDCAQLQFAEAKRLGKACIYDMPTCYYATKEKIDARLRDKYADWAIDDTRGFVMLPDQKRAELNMADLVLAPSRFVANSVHELFPHRSVAIAPYGVDLDAWPMRPARAPRKLLKFVYVGRSSLAKGTPLLLEAWRAANLKDAQLDLIGAWHMQEGARRALPPNCDWKGRVSWDQLVSSYHDADVFVFPTNYEGRALVVLEALATGLPVLASDACGADDAIAGAGRIFPAENLEALVEGLKWFDANRCKLPEMSRLARERAEECSWAGYRKAVAHAVRPYV